VNAGIHAIRCIESDRPIVVVYEDIDSWLDSHEEDILALTDGELQSNNVVYIATTNSVEDLPDRIKNRPSRFASVIETKYPTPKMRKAYIRHKLPDLNNAELLNLVEITDGMSLDHIKSLILSVFCLQCDMDKTLQRLKKMN
jgi:SpoVK/Ycf46/Vps4 family AAA+-type ATPase